MYLSVKSMVTLFSYVNVKLISVRFLLNFYQLKK